MREGNLRDVAEHFKDKISKIKVALFDVDGVLTDSRVWWASDEVGFNRFFNTQDGYGLKMLQMAGLKVGIITGGNSLGVHKRAENLKLDYVFSGDEDKRHAYQKVLDDGYTDEEILYMGDEFFDTPLLKRAGFSITPPHASLEVQEMVDYVSQREGGHGCVREVVDIIRYERGFVPDIPDFE